MGSQHFAYPPRIPAEGSQTSYGASVDALYRRYPLAFVKNIKHEEGDDTCLSAVARRPFATEARTARIKTTMRATTPALSAAARRPFATEARTARMKTTMRATTPALSAAARRPFATEARTARTKMLQLRLKFNEMDMTKMWTMRICQLLAQKDLRQDLREATLGPKVSVRAIRHMASNEAQVIDVMSFAEHHILASAHKRMTDATDPKERR